MKRFSSYFLVAIIAVMGIVITACGGKDNYSISLNQKNVTIYLDEDGTGSAIVNAKPVGFSSSKISLNYNTANISITSSRNSDGSFDLLITPKGIMDCQNQEVIVSIGGKATNSFMVNVVVPVVDIVVEEDIFVPFNFETLSYDLFSKLNFVPTGTKQTAVEFMLSGEVEGASIDGHNLVIDRLFVGFDNNILISVKSTEVGKADLIKTFGVKVVPNVSHFVSQVIIDVDDGSGFAPVKDNYSLSIASQKLGRFDVRVRIPKALGVKVEVDSKRSEQQNIMKDLYVKDEQKTTIVDGGVEYEQTTFSFDTSSLRAVIGNLYFKFSYIDAKYNLDQLSSYHFQTASGLKDYLTLDVNVPLEGISINTDVAQNAFNQYVIYTNYAGGNGSEFIFGAIPQTATNKIYKITSMVNVKVMAYDSETASFVELVENSEVEFGEKLYIVGQNVGAEAGLEVESITDSTKKARLDFSVQNGVSALAFVSGTELVSEKEVAVEVMSIEGTPVTVYAPGATLFDLRFEGVEMSETAEAGYFILTVKETTVGVKKYDIKTANGYKITLTVNAIQPINSVGLQIGASGSQDIAGVGKIDKEAEDLVGVSIKNGYSIPLNIIVNQYAETSKIVYSFIDAPLYSDAYADVYAEEYINFAKDRETYANLTYSSIATIVNKQNLNSSNLLSAIKEGKTLIKIEVFGYKVVEGVCLEAEPVAKYLLVEVYNPIKDITASEKIVELRAESELYEEDRDASETTINLSALSNSLKSATYSNLFIDGGELIDGTRVEYTLYNTGNVVAYTASLNLETSELSISVKNAPNVSRTQYITIFASDFFIEHKSGHYVNNFFLNEIKENYVCVAYRITLRVLETKNIDDININSLECKNTQTIVDGYARVKTYETIYLDTSILEPQQRGVYKIVASVLPVDAFNKNLSYKFVPNINVGSTIVDVSNNDGTIYYLGNQGGTGNIEITSLDPNNKNIKVIIPIIVADGTKEAPFRISSLSDMININKFYILHGVTSLDLNKTLFAGETFNGGLDGNGATIRLNGYSMFSVIGANAEIKNLTIVGDATAYGMVANSNHGTIDNVNVSTYIQNGVYVPSLLTIPVGTTNSSIGGIAGTNSGQIINSNFAGSIYENGTNGLTINGISDGGTITNCNVTQAKFDYADANIGRVVESDGAYYNGIVSYRTNGRLFADATTGASLTKAEKINNVKKGAVTQVYGDAVQNIGIVFYFKAQNQAKQEMVEEYNSINCAELICVPGANGNGAQAIALNHVKVLALNMDGTPCSFVSIDGNVLKVSGTGQFKLRIYSIYDYTVTNAVEFSMLSLYYFGNFSITDQSQKVYEPGANLNVVKGQKTVVKSNTTAVVDGVELVQNDFDIKFTFQNSDIYAPSYITGTKLGSHTITATWNDADDDGELLYVNISAGFGSIFDSLLMNKLFDGGEYKLNVSLKAGTTKIDLSAEEAQIEPKDAVSFNAIITTDIADDYIDDSTISIENQNGYLSTNLFDIEVSMQDWNNGKRVANIHITLKEENRADINIVDKVYIIKIKAKASGEGAETYSPFTTFNLTMKPQKLSSINATLYNFTSETKDSSIVSTAELATSIIKPTDDALLVIDLFPNYSTFDYVEIVSTSSNLAKLAYRIQKKDGTTYTYDPNAEYELISEQNGIRIKNNFVSSEDAQNIGSYYILIFPTSTLNEDSIININISAYYKGEKLEASTSFTLYVRMPQRPQISVDGEGVVFAHPGETFEANVLISSDQTYKDVKLVGELGEIDLKETKIFVVDEGENKNLNAKQYKIRITLDKDIQIDNNNKRFRVVVTSIKLDRGEHVEVESELIVYLLDFKIQDNSIVVKDVNQGIFNVSAIKYSTLELVPAFVYDKLSESSTRAVESFEQNYYYKNTNNGFTLGKEGAERAKVLASYLYVVNENLSTPIATILEDGKFAFNVGDHNRYISFDINNTYGEDNEIISSSLRVKGGEQTGQVQMLLRLEYVMPNSSKYIYEYNFTIVNSIYTTEDMPMEIGSASDLLDIENAEVAQDYILSKDIYLYDFETIAQTTKIKSLDGNNHTIHIMSFKEPTQNTVNYALFQTIAGTTTIKNLTVNYYYLNEILIADEIANVNFAGIAINNNGIITNCEVMAYKADEKNPTFTTYGIKINVSEKALTKVSVAGFVINNSGSITHSRVGTNEKLITTFDYTNDQDPQLITSTATAKMFTIRGAGTISGFVENNSGVIASSYVNNINIINTYNKNETMVTSGFANTNDGTITMSYAQGVKEIGQIQALLGGIEGSGILVGFVYMNNAEISDCYSNIMVRNSNQQVGRLGAGFAYVNNTNATIKTSYSFSSIAGNSTSQLYFVGVTEQMKYNNLGTIKNSYYYIKDDLDANGIETLYNTSIQPVKNVGEELSFYGFSFADSSELSSTWLITDNGPELSSANDIAHSVRYKKNIEKEGDSTLDYYFVYSEKYDLGTINNPIIIRDAKEFNGVFGDYKNSNTEIEENYNSNKTSQKVFGAYRLVNHINLNELIVDENDEGAKMYNLASTQMTLTGEQKLTSLRPGAFNGNGLTISGLAISNNETGMQNYGLFKSIENGAFFGNVNIALSGDVTSDHTENVGTIAGTVENASISNINISSQNTDIAVHVVGANIVGGAVGKVVGDSYISGITISNVSVTATYNRNEDVASTTVNVYNRNEPNKFKELSIAGGLFGVIDIFTTTQVNNNMEYGPNEYRFTNVKGVQTIGGFEISGMTVGGVAGFIDEYVTIKDISLILTKSSTPAKLIAYNCYAGGLVGFNRGSLYQARAEHEREWQEEIESNMSAYYKNSDASNSIDRGIEDLFISNNIDYAPNTIGGIVGVMDKGIINIAYSKIHVKNKDAQYAGGIAGIITEKTIKTDGKNREYIIQLEEVYSTSDVYAKEYVGGIFGYNKFPSLTLGKVASLNYWSKEALSANNVEQIGTSVATDIAISKISYLENVKFSNDEVQNVNGLKIVGEAWSMWETIDDKISIKPYYDYVGVQVDNGAQIDIAFKEFDWYQANWGRDNNEMFPHIKFTNPSSIYDIYSTKDFYLFQSHGHKKEAIFVVRAEKPIECSGWQITYSQLAGRIYGYHDNSGFANLGVELFEEINGGVVTSLRFEGCTKPFATRATADAQFTYLNYVNCNFESADGDVAGVVKYVDSTVDVNFQSISFNNCSLSSDEIKNSGLLFATHSGSVNEQNAKIKAITISNKQEVISNKISSNSNVGLLFGTSSGAEINGINIDKTGSENILNANVSVVSGTKSDANIGLIGGSVGTISVSEINFGKNTSINVVSNENTQAVQNLATSNEGATISVGALVGSVGEITIKSGETFMCMGSISVTGPVDVKYVGGFVGSANESLTIDGNEDAISGWDKGTHFANINVDAVGTTFAGGIVGHAKQISAQTGGGYLIYNGNILINQIKDASGKVYVGGMAGKIENDISKLQKTVFAGVIAFTNTESNLSTYYIGGLIGHLEKTTLQVEEVYSIGTISLTGGDDEGSLNTGTKSYIGGLIGQADENSTVTFSENKKSVVLTTIFKTTATAHKIDAVGEILGQSNGFDNVEYASNLTMCVSETDAINKQYKNIVNTEGEQTIPAELVDIFKNCNGSILKPALFNSFPNVEINTDYQEEFKEHNAGADAKVLYKIVKNRNIINFSSEIKYRKFYVTVQNNLVNHETKANQQSPVIYQMSLKNTIMFADGAEIASRATPFNDIDKGSAVSGLVAKVNNTNYATGTTNNAGFANNNSGIIYTCSVVEPLTTFAKCNTVEQTGSVSDYTTDFFSVVSFVVAGKNETLTIGGFVASNSGYIFGCNSNVQIVAEENEGQDNGKTYVGGFAGKNTGLIDYSYANGYIIAKDNVNITQLDLFAIGGNNTHSYTLFANKANEVEGTVSALTSAVDFEGDACETFDADLHKENSQTKAETILYGNPSKETYYTSNIHYNGNYPILAGGPFANITYIKRSSYVTQTSTTSNDGGLTDNVTYYTEYVVPYDAEDNLLNLFSENIYYKVTNITHLTKIEAGNHVLTRSLNMRDKELKATIVNINENEKVSIHGMNNEITNINLTDINLINKLPSDSKLYDIVFKNVKLNNSSGIVGENSGTILNAKVDGFVTVCYTADKKAGTLVGTNTGNVESSIISANIGSTGMSTKKYQFGGLVGSQSSGKITNCLVQNNVNLVELQGGITIHYGGMVATQSGGEISYCGVKSAEINVVGVSTVYVGGIVGRMTGGKITNCYTDKATTIVSGSENETIDEENGTCPTTTTSYAGGIVGQIDVMGNISLIENASKAGSSATISNCENRAKVTALAQWVRADGNQENKYKYNETTNSIFIYALMNSDANAGGIAGTGLEKANAEYLANFGEVYGGFKAWKPIASLGINGQGNAKKFALRTKLSVASGFAALAAGIFHGALTTGINFLITHGALAPLGITASIPGVGWIVAGAMAANAIYNAVEAANKYVEQLNIVVEINPFMGNSGTFNYGELENNNYDAGVDPKIKNLDIKMSDINEAFANIDGNLELSDKELAFKNVASNTNLQRSVTFLGLVETVIEPALFRTFKSIKIGEEIPYNFVVDDNTKNYRDGFFYYDDVVGNSVLKAIYYDTICPTLKEASDKLYSDPGENYKTKETVRSDNGDYDEYTLKTGIVIKGDDIVAENANQYLKFKTGDCLSSLNEDKATATSVNGWSGWTKDALDASKPKVLTLDEDSDGNYSYTLYNPKLWENLVYTINTVKDAETNEYLYQGTNVTIIIELQGDQKQIFVGDALINNFNGKLLVRANEKHNEVSFTNIRPEIGDMYENVEDKYETNFGLIKNSHSAEIDGFRYVASNNLANDGIIAMKNVSKEADSSFNFGTIIANVEDGGASGVKITNAKIRLSGITAEPGLAERLLNFGGFVGVAGGNVSIKNSLFETINPIKLYAEGQSNIAISGAFGGFVGKVARGTTNIQSSNVKINNISLITRMSKAGGLIGHVEDNANAIASDYISVELGNFNVAGFMNTYVGGVVGCNDGNLTLLSVYVNNSSNAMGGTISADVVNGNANAYAGGIVGFNAQGSQFAFTAITIGNNTCKEYNDILHILAGYSMIENSKIILTLPKESGAKHCVGNDSIKIDTINVLCRHISITTAEEEKLGTFEYSNKDKTLIEDAYFTLSNNIEGYGSTISFKTYGVSKDNKVPGTDKSSSFYVTKSTFQTNNKRTGYEYEVTFGYKDNSVYATKVDDNNTVQEVYYNPVSMDLVWKFVIIPLNDTISSTNKYLIQVYGPNTQKNEDGEIVIDNNNLQLIYAKKVDLDNGDNDSFTIPQFETLNPYFVDLESNASFFENDSTGKITVYPGNVMADIDIEKEHNGEQLGKYTNKLSSTETKICVTNEGISFVETLSLYHKVEKLSSATGDGKAPYWLKVSENMDNEVTRTLFTCELGNEESPISNEADGVEYKLDNIGGKPTTQQHVVNFMGETIKDNPEADADTTISIEQYTYTLPYDMGYKLIYGNREVEAIKQYDLSMFGRNYSIFSIQLTDQQQEIEGNEQNNQPIDFVELIYEKNTQNNKYAYVGKISYTVMSTDSVNFTKRHESFFPYENTKTDGIYNINSYIETLAPASDDFKDTIENFDLELWYNNLITSNLNIDEDENLISELDISTTFKTVKFQIDEGEGKLFVE